MLCTARLQAALYLVATHTTCSASTYTLSANAIRAGSALFTTLAGYNIFGGTADQSEVSDTGGVYVVPSAHSDEQSVSHSQTQNGETVRWWRPGDPPVEETVCEHDLNIRLWCVCTSRPPFGPMRTHSSLPLHTHTPPRTSAYNRSATIRDALVRAAEVRDDKERPVGCILAHEMGLPLSCVFLHQNRDDDGDGDGDGDDDTHKPNTQPYMSAILLPSYEREQVSSDNSSDAHDTDDDSHTSYTDVRTVRVNTPGSTSWVPGGRKHLQMNHTINVHYTDVTADMIQAKEAVMTGQAAYCIQLLYESLPAHCQAKFYMYHIR